MDKNTTKRGGRLGNQNARKHGFYARYLTAEERLELAEATLVQGLDEEIALMRVKIQGIMDYDPQNIELISRAMNTLAGLIRTKYNLNRDDKQGLKEAVGNVLRDVALPLGLSLGNFVGR